MAITLKHLIFVVIYFLCRVSVSVALPIGNSLVTRDLETSIHLGIYSDLGPDIHRRQPTDSKGEGVGNGKQGNSEEMGEGKRKRWEMDEEGSNAPKKKSRFTIQPGDTEEDVQRKNKDYERKTLSYQKKSGERREKADRLQKQMDIDRQKDMGPEELAKDIRKVKQREKLKEKGRQSMARVRANKEPRLWKLPAPETSVAGSSMVTGVSESQLHPHDAESNSPESHTPTNPSAPHPADPHPAAPHDDGHGSESVPPPAHPSAPHPSIPHPHPTGQLPHTSTHAHTTGVTTIDHRLSSPHPADLSHLSPTSHGDPAQHLDTSTRSPAGGSGVDPSSTQHQSQPPHPDNDDLELQRARDIVLRTYQFNSKSHSDGPTTLPISQHPHPPSPPGSVSHHNDLSEVKGEPDWADWLQDTHI